MRLRSLRMRSVARPLVFTALACAALFFACSDKRQGGLVVVIDTNASVPKDIDALGLAVNVGGITKFSNVYGIAPEGKVTMPATLLLEEPSAPAQSVTIRITGFSGGKVRIVRDSITTVPHARVAVLRLQLSALSFDDGAVGSINPQEVDRTSDPSMQSAERLRFTNTASGAFDPFTQITSKCSLTAEFADIDGVCQSAAVDSESLPDAASTPFLPTASELAACFDVPRCFADATLVMPHADCTFPFAGDPATLNVAVVTDGVGFQTSVGSLAPLDQDADHGFSVANGIVSLPKAVCAGNPRVKSVVIARACPAKKPAVPIVGGGTACAPSTFEGGASDGAAQGP